MNGLKRVCLALSACGILLLPQIALGAGFQETTQSAVSVGMANVGVANPEEPNSSYYNPAAMSFRDGLNTTTGVALIAPIMEYEPLTEGPTVDNERAVFALPHLHLDYAITEDLSAGVGMNAPYGLTVEWPENWVGRDVNEFVQIASLDLNPNISYEIADTGLSVAGGVQIRYSWVELRRDVQLAEDRFIQSELGGDGFGVGGVAALMYRPDEHLTIGAQYRSRVNVEYTDARVHFEGEENTPFYRTFRDNPGTADITFPDAIAAGVSYRWQRLMAEFDVGYTVWDTFDVIEVDIDTGGDEEALSEFELEQRWENAFVFRLGGQYDVTPQIPVRLGVAYDITPAPDETVNATLPDNNRMVGSIGAGYKWDQYSVDAAYELVGVDEREIRNEVGPAGDYSTVGHVLGLNFSYGYE